MNELISIIVPVYNVEKYLSKCLDSIVNQTYKNLEIVVINDGSTDHSLEICKQYAKKYSNIKLINQKNKGIAETRNVGIKESNGKYITFVDSDDYIDFDMIEKLYQCCKVNNADISSCGIYCEDEKGRHYLKNTLIKETKYSNIEALKKFLLGKEIDSSTWNKLYLRELWNNIKFPKNEIYEDLAVIYKVLYKSSKIVHIGVPKYHYIIRNGSITHRKFEIKHLSSTKFWLEICAFFENIDNDLYEMALSRYYLSLINTDMQIKSGNEYKIYKNEYNNIKTEINKNIKNIMKNKYISFSKKIMSYMAYLNLEIIVIFIKEVRVKIKQFLEAENEKSNIRRTKKDRIRHVKIH